MSKHTPGPLTVRQQPSWPFDIETIDKDGNVIFVERRHAYSTAHKSVDDVMSAKGFKGESRDSAIEANEQQLADAYLRAAAPDLLESLIMAQGIVAMLGGTPDPEDPYADRVQISAQKQIKDAIAKATGETECSG